MNLEERNILYQIKKIEKEGKISIKTPCQLEALEMTKKLKSITIKFDNGKIEKIETDIILRFFWINYETWSNR